jgi:hypothetical protein
MPDGYRVFVVLDREFGDRLSELPRTGAVWIVDTPLNRAAAQKIWAVEPNRGHLDGVTTFKTGDDCSPEDNLINRPPTGLEDHIVCSDRFGKFSTIPDSSTAYQECILTSSDRVCLVLSSELSRSYHAERWRAREGSAARAGGGSGAHRS